MTLLQRSDETMHCDLKVTYGNRSPDEAHFVAAVLMLGIRQTFAQAGSDVQVQACARMWLVRLSDREALTKPQPLSRDCRSRPGKANLLFCFLHEKHFITVGPVASVRSKEHLKRRSRSVCLDYCPPTPAIASANCNLVSLHVRSTACEAYLVASHSPHMPTTEGPP